MYIRKTFICIIRKTQHRPLLLVAYTPGIYVAYHTFFPA
jgi:hypothetical protein